MQASVGIRYTMQAAQSGQLHCAPRLWLRSEGRHLVAYLAGQHCIDVGAHGLKTREPRHLSSKVNGHKQHTDTDAGCLQTLE